MEGEGETNRFENVAFHVELAGNFQIASSQMVEWIKESDIRKEQMINISANETTIESGDCELVLYYLRKKEPDWMPLDNLTFSFIKNMDEWDENISSACKTASSGCEVIAITHTPKSIGRLNVQILWFQRCPTSVVIHAKSVDDKAGNIESVMNEQIEYLNANVAPH